MSASFPLKDYLILLVEDDPLIGLDIGQTLQDAGAGVLGPCMSAPAALSEIDALARTRDLHGAVLDFNLGDHTSEPVCQKLRSLQIPFIFHTGDPPGDDETKAGSDAPVVPKPSNPTVLIRILAQCIRDARSAELRDRNE